MSVIDVKFYRCDLCLRSFDHPAHVRNVLLPARHYDRDGKKYAQAVEPVDLCQVCFDKFFELIDSKFATIEVGGGQRKIYSYRQEEDKENSDHEVQA